MSFLNKNSKQGNKKLPVVATLISLLAFVIMLWLGLWQLDRAEQKQIRQQQIQQRKLHQAYSLRDIQNMKGDIRDYPVSISGRFMQTKYFLIDNRIDNGRVGYHLVAIMSTHLGNVAVNLGWIAAPASRAERPSYALPSGQQEITGMVGIPELNPMIRETLKTHPGWPARIQQLDLAIIEQLAGIELVPFVLLAHTDPNNLLTQHWQPVVMPPEKHIAYAIQWFGLAIALLVIFIIVLKRNQRDHPDEK